MCCTCLSGLLRDLDFYFGVAPVGGDCMFNGGGGLFVLKCVTYTIYCVFTNDKLLCAKAVFIENMLAYAVVKILLARRSEVVLTRDYH